MRLNLSLEIDDRSGIILRIALLLERRGYQILSLSISHPEGESNKKMFLVVAGEASKKSQIIKQLEKLVDVFSVKEIPIKAAGNIKQTLKEVRT